MNLKSSLALVVVLLAASACGKQSAEATLAQRSLEDEATLASSAPLGAAPVTLAFTSDWNIAQSWPLIAGGSFQVQYAPERLPQCRGELNGHPAWSITGYYQVNGGAIASFEAGGFSPSSGTAPTLFSLPSAGDLAVWFQITNAWGCGGWDSKFGQNYHFPISPTPTVHFRPDWTTSVDGLPGSAPTLLIDYDLARLPSCRQLYNGFAAWEVLAYYRFDGGPVSYAPVTQVVGMTRVAAPAALSVPPGASEVELWFKSSDRAGCVGWDSQYGANYRFRLN